MNTQKQSSQLSIPSTERKYQMIDHIKEQCQKQIGLKPPLQKAKSHIQLLKKQSQPQMHFNKHYNQYAKKLKSINLNGSNYTSQNQINNSHNIFDQSTPSNFNTQISYSSHNIQQNNFPQINMDFRSSIINQLQYSGNDKKNQYSDRLNQEKNEKQKLTSLNLNNKDQHKLFSPRGFKDSNYKSFNLNTNNNFQHGYNKQSRNNMQKKSKSFQKIEHNTQNSPVYQNQQQSSFSFNQQCLNKNPDILQKYQFKDNQKYFNTIQNKDFIQDDSDEDSSFMEALENLKKQDYMGNQLNQSLGDDKISKLKATQIYNESEKKMQKNLNFLSQNHINMTAQKKNQKGSILGYNQQKHVKRLQSANRNKKSGLNDYINSNNITYTNDEYYKNDSSHQNLDYTNQINDVSATKNLNKFNSNSKLKLQKNYSRNNQNELFNTGCSENKNKQINTIPKRSTSHNIINNQQYAPVFDTNNYNYKFPDWLNKRVDFQNLQTLEHFDMNKKILSVAKTPSSDRMPPEIQLVALFLKKLSLFRLMPQYLLEFIAGKIYTQSFINQQTQQKEFRSYNHGEYICRQGDQGNSMFIIFRGQVEVLIGGNVVETFQLKELIGRTALENEVPRTADLRAKGNVDLLILNRQDYQHCIFQFVKQERENLGEFIRSIPFINKSFNEQKIKKLTRDVKIKFFAPKDKLYMEGHQIDGVYIIKEGSFILNIQVKLDYQNQWPLKVKDKKIWEKRITSKVVDYNIKYTAQQILGFSEIIDPPNNGVRKETISAVEDTIAIFIPKSQFTTIFDEHDFVLFRDYLKQMNPQTKESLIMKVKNDENNMKQRMQQIERALKQNLKTYNHEKIQIKQRKMDGIIQNTNKKLKDDMKKQLPYRLSKVVFQIDQK